MSCICRATSTLSASFSRYCRLNIFRSVCKSSISGGPVHSCIFVKALAKTDLYRYNTRSTSYRRSSGCTGLIWKPYDLWKSSSSVSDTFISVCFCNSVISDFLLSCIDAMQSKCAIFASLNLFFSLITYGFAFSTLHTVLLSLQEVSALATTMGVGRCTFSNKTVVLFSCLGQFTVKYASVYAGIHNVRGTVTQLISSNCECIGKLITSSYSDKSVSSPVCYGRFICRKKNRRLTTFSGKVA